MLASDLWSRTSVRDIKWENFWLKFRNFQWHKLRLSFWFWTRKEVQSTRSRPNSCAKPCTNRCYFTMHKVNAYRFLSARIAATATQWWWWWLRCFYYYMHKQCQQFPHFLLICCHQLDASTHRSTTVQCILCQIFINTKPANVDVFRHCRRPFRLLLLLLSF